MRELSEPEAIGVARRRLGLTAGTAARSFRVRSADRPAQAYYLLVFGEPDAAVGVAAVDVVTGEVTNWATLPGTAPHALIEPETAVRRAGAAAGSRAELVWRSSPASRSPLYPLWQIETDETTVYVDQQERLWPSLDSPGRGG